MIRTLYAFLLVFLVSGKSAYCQSRSSFLVYENDTINRIDEHGMKTGPWVYFWRDTTLSVNFTISSACYASRERHSYCESSGKRDTFLHYTCKIIARGNYIRDLKKGRWIFGEDTIKKYHGMVTFSHDTVSKLAPILAYDDSSRNYGSVLFEKGDWRFCNINNKTGVYTEWRRRDGIQEFLDVFCNYEQMNYPSKFAVQ